MRNRLYGKMLFIVNVILLVFYLAGSVSAQDLPDVHFFAVNDGPFYVVNEDLRMYLSVKNFSQGEELEIRYLHPNLTGGKDYVGAAGKYYVIYDTYYRRTTNLQTNAEAAQYSLHTKFQGGKHYFSVGEYFYMITADGKKYRKTTNMNKATDFNEYTIHSTCQNGDFYFAREGAFYYAKINEGRYYKVENFKEGKSLGNYTIAADVLEFVKKRPAPQPLDVADVHFLANVGGPYYAVNEDLGLFLTVTNFYKAENLKYYQLHEELKGGRDYVASDGKFYVVYDKTYKRTTNLHTNADAVEYPLDPRFQGGKHYFATGDYFYMISPDGKNYRRAKNMKTAEEYNEFQLSGECQKGDYYFAVTGSYYFADISNGIYHKVDNFEKNKNHRMYPINSKIIDFVKSKPLVASQNQISFSATELSVEQKADFLNRRSDYSYTFFPDSDGQIILAIYTSEQETANEVQIVRVEEKNGVVDVYVQETSPKPGEVVDRSAVVKLHTTNQKISISLQGLSYYYFVPSVNKLPAIDELPADMDQTVREQIELAIKIKELAKKYAPQLRFHPDEISYPSPVEGIVNRAYKVKPLPEEFTKLTSGKSPELAMNDDGTVLEIHHTAGRYWNGSWFSTNYNHEIHYRIGTLDADGSVKFSGHKELTTGVNPTIAINKNNVVMEAHEHSTEDKIDLRYGTLNDAKSSVTFKALYNVAAGENPSVSINDAGLFIMVNEKDNGGQLEYHLGRLTDGEVTFYKKKETIPYKGYRPGVDINNSGQVVLSYDCGDQVYYQIGQFMDEYKLIYFGEPVLIADGDTSSIELNDYGYVVCIYQNSDLQTRANPNDEVGLYTMLHYRYGRLQMNYGLGNPEIEFSQYIELCSGDTPDIVLNKQGDVVEIHGTSSPFNADLHYRVLKSAEQSQNPQIVTALTDLPRNQKGYILVQKGTQSWEAPGSDRFKIYVVASKVEDNIELEYNFFYPTNGTNISGLDLLKHIGDWEKIYVTVDADGEVVNYRYNHHAESTTFEKGEIKLADGTHPVVYVALQTHASYPKNDFLGVFQTGDEVSDNGPYFNPYDNDQLEVVKIYGVIAKDQDWIHWRGRWGSTLNSPDSKLWK